MQTHESEFIIKIDKVLYGGMGIGHLNGMAVMVKQALPGDIVLARTISRKKDYKIAEIIRIENPSCMRISPPCPVFEECGGCTYLNLSYADEINVKMSQIHETLKRIGGFKENELPEIEISHAERSHYRSHGRIHLKNGTPGFYKKDSNSHVPLPVNGCMLFDEKLNQSIATVQHNPGEARLAIDMHGNCIKTPDEKTIFKEKVDNFLYKRTLLTFFQANQYLRSTMLNKVLEYAQLDSNESFADIGCGCGFFTIPCATQAGKGTGFDINKHSIKLAVENAAMNGCDNLKFYAAPDHSIHPARYSSDCVICDPPRQGLSRRARETINAMGPSRIVYVSCGLSTFARDLSFFCKKGFKPQKICFIDMFPCTHHIEIISLITR